MNHPGNTQSLLTFEQDAQQDGFKYVLGLDEAGRGPLAGPVVAAAVLLKTTDFTHPIRDSKKLSALQRERAFHEIMQKACVGIGIMNETVIDAVNILQATYCAMTNAVYHLVAQLPDTAETVKPNPSEICLLIDGNRFQSELPYAYRTIIGGDSKSLSIACASIIAKVSRDRILCAYDKIYPHYGFRQHKGYPTAKHRQAVKEHGLSPIHRLSFHA